MKPTDQMISLALDYLAGTNNIVTSKGRPNDNDTKKVIANAIKGYVASFGGSVVQIGLPGSVLTYFTDAKRKCVIEAIEAIYNGVYSDSHISASGFQAVWNNLSYSQKLQVRERVVKVAIALKLAMRTYEFDESDPIE